MVDRENFQNTSSKFSLVENSYVYWDFIRALRNMDGIRESFIQQKIISKRDHESYMKINSHYFWICVDHGVPIGYVGIIEDDIRVATHPNHQGKGVGKFMINEIMKNNPNAFAKVKIENEASLKLFESCGFKKSYYILEKE